MEYYTLSIIIQCLFTVELPFQSEDFTLSRFYLSLHAGNSFCKLIIGEGPHLKRTSRHRTHRQRVNDFLDAMILSSGKRRVVRSEPRAFETCVCRKIKSQFPLARSVSQAALPSRAFSNCASISTSAIGLVGRAE
eukprot:IDg17039t1